MRQVKASELVFDFGVYPRAAVDKQHVGYIAQAIQAGAEMPPVVVCKKTRRIVDGFHRTRAMQQIHGPDAPVTIVEKTYRDEKALFLDTVRYNSSHGRNLTTYDRAHCSILATNLGIDDAAIASALHVSEQYLGDLRVDRAAVVGEGAAGLHVPIKRTIRHMAGKHLTQEQARANESLSGMNQLFYVNQVITLIEAGLLDTANEPLLTGLRRLGKLIADRVPPSTERQAS